MTQIPQVVDYLKSLLKANNLTYKDLAEHLGMSEANIKRIFSTENFSLDTLENICAYLKLSLSDLFRLAAEKAPQLEHLSAAQEQELIEDPKLLLVAVCARDSWTFEEIVAHYQISEHEAIRLFARLDKLKMLNFLPGNKYKLLVAQDFRWLPNGPLEKFMTENVVKEFMNANFAEKNSFRFYLRGSYSQASIAIIQSKLNQLTKEVALLNHADAKLPLDLRQHTGLLLAMRPWELEMFEKMRRV